MLTSLLNNPSVFIQADKELLEKENWKLKEPHVYEGNGVFYQIFCGQQEPNSSKNLTEIKVVFRENWFDRLTQDICKIIVSFLHPQEALHLLQLEKNTLLFSSLEGQAIRDRKKAIMQAFALINRTPKTTLFRKAIAQVHPIDPPKVKELETKYQLTPYPFNMKVKYDIHKSNVTEYLEILHQRFWTSKFSFYRLLAEVSCFTPLLDLFLKELEKKVEVLNKTDPAFKKIVTEALKKKLQAEDKDEDLTSLYSFQKDKEFAPLDREMKIRVYAQMANWHSLSNVTEAKKFLDAAIDLLSQDEARNELLFFIKNKLDPSELKTCRPLNKEAYQGSRKVAGQNCLEAIRTMKKAFTLALNTLKDEANRSILIERFKLSSVKNFVYNLDEEEKKCVLDLEAATERMLERQEIFHDTGYLGFLELVFQAMVAIDPETILEGFREKAKSCNLHHVDYFLQKMVTSANNVVIAMKIVDLIEDSKIKRKALKEALRDYSL